MNHRGKESEQICLARCLCVCVCVYDVRETQMSSLAIKRECGERTSCSSISSASHPRTGLTSTAAPHSSYCNGWGTVEGLSLCFTLSLVQMLFVGDLMHFLGLTIQPTHCPCFNKQVTAHVTCTVNQFVQSLCILYYSLYIVSLATLGCFDSLK